jgi:hypothetical protein
LIIFGTVIRTPTQSPERRKCSRRVPIIPASKERKQKKGGKKTTTSPADVTAAEYPSWVSSPALIVARAEPTSKTTWNLLSYLAQQEILNLP